MGIEGVDLNLMTSLHALLTERNVTRAAERCSVGQPAMSATLARLRKHFGDPLLVRDGKELAPTALADTLLPLTREAVVAAEAVFSRSPGFDPALDRRSFTIMASDYVTLILLRGLVLRLAEVAPLQRVNVAPVRPDFADRLRAGSVDLLILPTEFTGARFALPHRHLFDDRFVLVADADNDEVHDGVTAEQLSRLPYLAFSGGPMPAVAESQLDALGIARRVEMTTQSLVVAPLMIAGTPFVALVHALLARQVADTMRLKIVEPEVPLRPISEMLAWNPRTAEDPAHVWMREQIVAQAAALGHRP